MIFTTLFSLAQSDYPKVTVDSSGIAVVTMTLEQAQVLDNKAELLDLFEKLNGQLGDYDSVCIRVINEKDIVIAKQDVQIKKLNDLSNNKDKQIENLQSQIADYKKSELLSKELISNKDKEIGEHKDEIKRLKTKMVIGGSTGGLIIIGLIILLIK
jgi:hypothetical protein